MTGSSAEIVVCGAGIAGIAAAYHLAVRRKIRRVVLVDERPPLTLTSDKSTECYRNWWPGPDGTMAALTNRSIDLLEELARETGNAFQMNRRGYLFAAAEEADALVGTATQASANGAGPLRRHRGNADGYAPAPPHGFEDQPVGIDLFEDRDLIQRHFPYLSERAVAVAHARRCGWLSAQQLGMTMLNQARDAGATLLRGRLSGVDSAGGRIRGVTVDATDGARTIAAPILVNAAGPYVGAVAELCGLDLPLTLEGHVKVSFDDPHGAMPRHAPLVIWNDPVRLPWSNDERRELAVSVDTCRLLEPFAAGVHGRPEGAGNNVLLYWTYDPSPDDLVFPVPYDPNYPEIALRGMSAAIPLFSEYLERLPRPYVDGGYYAKTVENRPLIGPLPLAGAYICGAFSGFGIMAAMAAGELLAAHVADAPLPDYAPAFALARYDDPAYQRMLAKSPASGQL